MPDMGEAGQEALLAAKVLVVGAGGLGAPAMLYLVSAGVGSITIIDDDMVSRSDLNRQIIYQTQDIGSQKVKQAATAARKLNPDIKLSTLPVRATIGNIRKLVAAHDVIVDCSDNVETRYLLGDTAHREKTLSSLAVRCAPKARLPFSRAVSQALRTALFPLCVSGNADASQAPGCSKPAFWGR